MGSLKGGTPTTTTTTNQPPPQVMQAYQWLTGTAQNVAAQNPNPFPYTGQMVAGMTPDQMAALGGIFGTSGVSDPWLGLAGQNFAGAGNLIGSGANVIGGAMPAFGQAAQYTAQGTTPYYNTVGNYLSPYINDVVNATQNQFNNANAIQSQNLLGQAIRAGNAFGGDRAGIAQAELANQQQLAQAPVISGLYNQGYQQAMQAAQAQNAQALQAAGLTNQTAQGMLGAGAGLGALGGQLAGIGTQAGSLGLGAGNQWLSSMQAALQGSGLEQQTQQQALNAAYQQWMMQQGFPYQQTGWLANIIEGLGAGSGGTSTGQTTPGFNLGSTLLGAGMIGSQTGLFSGLGSAATALGTAGSNWLADLLIPSLAIAVKRGGAVNRQSGGPLPMFGGSDIFGPIQPWRQGIGMPERHFPEVKDTSAKDMAAAKALGQAFGKSGKSSWGHNPIGDVGNVSGWASGDTPAAVAADVNPSVADVQATLEATPTIDLGTFDMGFQEGGGVGGLTPAFVAFQAEQAEEDRANADIARMLGGMKNGGVAAGYALGGGFRQFGGSISGGDDDYTAPGYNVPRRQVVDYIRQAAQERGIDPNTALRVAASEGLNNWQSTVMKGGMREPSYGPFQLYTQGGLGNEFQTATGLDPADPNNWQKGVDFALDRARQGGWAPWYGARRAGITGMQGIDGQGGGPLALAAPEDGVGASEGVGAIARAMAPSGSPRTAAGDLGGEESTDTLAGGQGADTVAGGEGATDDADARRQAIMAAGFAMMAGRSPRFMQNVGEAGMVGMSTYAQARKLSEDAKKVQAQINRDEQRQRLADQREEDTRKWRQMQEDRWNKQFELQQNRPIVVPPGSQLQTREGKPLATAPTQRDQLFSTPRPPELGKGPDEQFYNDLRATDQPFADDMKRIAEGRGKWPSIAGRGAGAQYGLDMRKALTRYEPGLDETLFAQRQKTRNDWAPNGKSGQSITSFNFAGRHVADLGDLMAGLNPHQARILNSTENWLKTQFSDPQLEQVRNQAVVVATEVPKMLRGAGVLNQEEERRWNERVNAPGAKYESFLAGLGQIGHAMKVRNDEMVSQYKGIMKSEPDYTLSPEAQAAFDKMEGWRQKYGVGVGKQYKKGDVVPRNGVEWEFQGGDWKDGKNWKPKGKAVPTTPRKDET